MMRRSGFIFILVLVAMLASLQAQAFDGQRKGFMLNLGAGYGQGEFKAKGGGESVSWDGTGLMTDFKIGGGINEKMVLYYTNRALWYTVDFEFFDQIISTDLINGMSAFGASYFLEPTAPSFFFSGAIGIGVVMDSDADESESGVGFTLGIGYEFSKNWILEGTYMSAKVDEVGEVDLTASNLAVTISWFAY